MITGLVLEGGGIREGCLQQVSLIHSWDNYIEIDKIISVSAGALFVA